MEKTTYNTLAQIQLNDNKYLVISECIKDGSFCGYTIGQKVTAKDGNNNIDIFLKGTIQISGIDTLKEIYAKIGECIEKVEKN